MPLATSCAGTQALSWRTHVLPRGAACVADSPSPIYQASDSVSPNNSSTRCLTATIRPGPCVAPFRPSCVGQRWGTCTELLPVVA